MPVGRRRPAAQVTVAVVNHRPRRVVFVDRVAKLGNRSVRRSPHELLILGAPEHDAGVVPFADDPFRYPALRRIGQQFVHVAVAVVFPAVESGLLDDEEAFFVRDIEQVIDGGAGVEADFVEAEALERVDGLGPGLAGQEPRRREVVAGHHVVAAQIDPHAIDAVLVAVDPDLAEAEAAGPLRIHDCPAR